MKKLALILGLMLTINTAANAGTYGMTCPANPYSQSIGLSNITGINFLSEKIANAIIKKAILKDSKGKYKVDMQSYNLSSLKQGIFKSLEVTGKDTVTDGVYISNIKLKTLCDYNYIALDNKNKTATFKEDFNMAYALQFTEDDLINTMQTNRQYLEMIRKANSIGNASKLFNIVSTSAKIKDNKLYYTMKVAIPLIKKRPEIVIETDMKARNGEIVLNDSKLVTDSFKLDMSKLEKILNFLNPLEFAMGIFEEKQAVSKVQEITIQNNTVNIIGTFTIPKDVVTEQ